MIEGTVYLLHFDKPIGNAGNRRGQARHYIGWTADLESRLTTHRRGAGAAIMAAVKAAGVTWSCVRTWAGTRELERSLKLKKRAASLCPTCNPKVAP